MISMILDRELQRQILKIGSTVYPHSFGIIWIPL